MPRSARNKIVSLTATQKRPLRENNARLYTTIQESVNIYPTAVVFSVQNMRNTHLKTIRAELSDSRLFFGKNKVMAKALGTEEADETRPALHSLSSHLSSASARSGNKGNVEEVETLGLLLSPRKPEELVEYLSGFKRQEFARMGAVAPETVVIPAGIVGCTGGMLGGEDEESLPHSLETTVRGLGMPTRLVKGKIMLEQQYIVCKAGQKLDAKQASLLKVFGRMAAEFAVRPVAYWTSETETVTVLEEQESDV